MKYIRSKKYLEAARDMPCVNCGVNDGSVVAAHYQGIRGNTYGRGTGVKCHDILVADLCRTCHEEFDGYKNSHLTDRQMRKIDMSERFLHCIAMTLIRRCRQGIITP